MAEGLNSLVGDGLVAVRSRGLWAGIDVDPSLMTGRGLCEALLTRGVLAKDTHSSTIRIAPPLVVSEDDIAFMVDPEWKGRGLGRALMDVVVDYARRHGVVAFTADVLSENLAMLRLFGSPVTIVAERCASS